MATKIIFFISTISLLIIYIFYIDWKANYPNNYSYKNLTNGSIETFTLDNLPKNRWNNYQFIDSYSTKEIIEMPRPKNLPDYLSWDYQNKKAYLDGRIFYNNDSTLSLIAH